MSRVKWLGIEALFLGGLALVAVAIFTLPGCSEEPTAGQTKVAAHDLACTDPEAYEVGCGATCPAGEVCTAFDDQGLCACILEGSAACHEEDGACVSVCPGGIDCGRSELGRCGCLL